MTSVKGFAANYNHTASSQERFMKKFLAVLVLVAGFFTAAQADVWLEASDVSRVGQHGARARLHIKVAATRMPGFWEVAPLGVRLRASKRGLSSRPRLLHGAPAPRPAMTGWSDITAGGDDGDDGRDGDRRDEDQRGEHIDPLRVGGRNGRNAGDNDCEDY